MAFVTTWMTVLGFTMVAGCATVQGRSIYVVAMMCRKEIAIATEISWMQLERAGVLAKMT